MAGATTVVTTTESVEKATPIMSSAQQMTDAALSTAATIQVGSYSLNLMGILIGIILLGVFWMFYRIQSQSKLDFADMVTKDGKAVSLTKVLQLIGGLTATWVMIKLTLTGGLTEALFGLYLTYVGAIEGYSKFVAAKYNYNEKSVKQARAEDADAKE